MKIKLKCIYGSNMPDDVIDLESKKAQSMIDEGAAVACPERQAVQMKKAQPAPKKAPEKKSKDKE